MTTLFDPEFFPTPATVVHLMLSKISSGARYFLEPSAGKGDIAEGIKKRYPYAKVDCIEQSPELIRSLSDAKIATIVRWVDGGSAMDDSKDLPLLKNFPEDDGWQLSKIYGQPDLVLKSDSYTMPAHGQDVWFKPLTEVTLSEPRWVRAVEMRPGTIAGRKIMHHVLARLIQEEPAAVVTAGAAADGGAASAGLLMEWAIGKNYDIYRPNCGKLLLPGSHIWWELHLHAVGEEIRDHAELAVYSIRRARHRNIART